MSGRTLVTAPIASMPIGDVHVGERQEGLCASVAEVGLLHPVVVTPEGTLIAGARRLEAAKRLGWDAIPVNIINLDDVVRGEFAENVHRKPFTPSEMAAIADAIEPSERAKAKERQGERTDQHREKFSRSSRGRALDKMATLAGVSRPTLVKAREVCRAADLNPDHCAPIRDEMDATGNVDRAFKHAAWLTKRSQKTGRQEFQQCWVCRIGAVHRSEKKKRAPDPRLGRRSQSI